jgi:transcriptional regulator with XRE-family HTH domain
MPASPLKPWSELGDTLRRLRLARDVQQSEIIAALGGAFNDPRHLRRIESGLRRPSRQALILWLTKGLGVTDIAGVDKILVMGRYEGLSREELQRFGIRAPGDVQITEPASGVAIAAGTWAPVRGEAHDLGPGLRVWVLLVGETGLIWPQQRALFVSDTTWEAWVRFGAGTAERGNTPAVIAVVASEESQRQFEEYLIRGAEAGHRYTPLRSLPRTAEEKSRIVVTLT